MELREPPADGARVALTRRSRGEPPQQRGVLVVAPHLHCVLDRSGLVFVRDLEAASCGRHDRLYASVDVGRQSPVEANLLVTEQPAALERAVVHARQPDGLLELVGRVPGQQHPRDVGLAKLGPERMLKFAHRRRQRRRCATWAIPLRAHR